MNRCTRNWFLPALGFTLLLTGCQTANFQQNPLSLTPPHGEQMPVISIEADFSPTPDIAPDKTSAPTRTPGPTRTPTPTQTPAPVSWSTLAAGVSQAWYPVYSTVTAVPQIMGYVYVLRLDPSRVDVRMHYDPVTHTVEEWQELSGAMIVVNGGFFSGRNTPVGRIVSDGTLYGFPLVYEEDSIGVPGLFAIVDGEAAIYSMGRSPFSPRGLRFDTAVECYPMLLLPGGQPGFERETGMLARRTAVGLDEDGNIIIVFVDTPIFSLHRFAKWLARANLGLDTALNLDGGRSSGLAVGLGEGRVFPSVVPLPIVLAVYPR